MQMITSRKTDLIDAASRMIYAGADGSTHRERYALADVADGRANVFRVLYKSHNNSARLGRQARPWMVDLADGYEQLAINLRAV